MLTSIVLSMTVAAPVPVAPPAAESGPIPRLMEVKAADGKVTVTVLRYEMQKIQVGAAAPPGGAPPAVITREVRVPKVAAVELSEVKDLTITTADGKKVNVADAVKKLKDGGVVVVSADGKPVSPNHLKLFKDDVLVFASPELTNVQNVLPGVRPGGVIRPLPALPGLPPGGIQIQPGVIQVAPALPVVPAKPVPAPDK